MQCTACQKTLATIHVLELTDGEVVSDQSLCQECARAAGYVHAKPTAMKISPEMLEDLIGGLKTNLPQEPSDPGFVCPACGLTSGQFRSRGRLGCPRCYEMFKKSLIPLLEKVHDATSHRGRCPGKPANLTDADDRLADLRSSLRDAIDAENYELAARLRDEIKNLSGSGEADE